MKTNSPLPTLKELWNGSTGEAWVTAQEILDGMFRPIEDRLVEATKGASSVLDVGCGTGSTTLAIARSVPKALGIDISEPMLAHASRRAREANSSAEFLLADAELHDFSRAAFDLVVSRFGVMFFGDPVRAFSNLRAASAPSGRLLLFAWRSAAENPFMTTAERAAAPLLPELPKRDPNGPGQFAFADGERVRKILGESGWQKIVLEPVDFECSFPLDSLETYFTLLGPVGTTLRKLPDSPERNRIVEAVRAAFEPFIEGNSVRYVASCWQASAHGS